MSGAFAKVPVEVLQTGNGYAIAVYAAIAQHANRSGGAHPSLAKLQEITGWSRPTVVKAIGVLCEAKVLVKNHRSAGGMKQSNAYDLPLHTRANDEDSQSSKTPKDQMETTLPTMETTLPTLSTTFTQDVNDVYSGSKPGFHEQEPVEQEPVEQDIPPISPKPKPKAKPKTKHLIPDDFGISDRLVKWAEKSGFTIAQMESQLERFRNNALMKQNKYADWDAAFQNWMSNARDWGHLKAVPGGLTVYKGGNQSPPTYSRNPRKSKTADDLMEEALELERMGL